MECATKLFREILLVLLHEKNFIILFILETRARMTTVAGRF